MDTLSLGSDDELSILSHERRRMEPSVLVNHLVKNFSADQASPTMKINNPGIVI
jgi:hypothetical protein